MYEQDKLEEARYFLVRMTQTQGTSSFRFELSAFLSAARSALQYALEEAKIRCGGKAWYDSAVSRRHVVTFFKKKRDLNIHTEPVSPNASVEIGITPLIGFGDLPVAQLNHGEDRPAGDESVSRPPPVTPASDPCSVGYSYSFLDWKGTEDVLALCKHYLEAVSSILMDGYEKGYLCSRSIDPRRETEGKTGIVPPGLPTGV